MRIDMGELSGVIPILVTPIDEDGHVDEDSLEREIEFLVEAGVQWAGFGFGSEVHRLGSRELATTVIRAVNVAGGRLGIFGNAEVRSGPGGAEAVQAVAAAGAQMALVRPSGFDGVIQEEVFDTLAFVAERGDIPIIVQDAPQNTSVDLTASTLARLLVEAPGVAAVKVEPANPVQKMSRVVEALSGSVGRIIGGAGGVDYLHEIERGAVGTMPGPAYPELFMAIERLHGLGELKTAYEMLSRALPIMVLARRDMETFLFIQKYILQKRQILDGIRLARPHRVIDPCLRGEIDELIDVCDFWGLIDTCKQVLRSK